MYEILCLTFAITLLVICFFWLLIAVAVLLMDGDLRRFSVAVTLEDARQTVLDEDNLEELKRQLVRDMKSIKLLAVPTGEAGEDVAVKPSTLINEGIAENQTAARRDDADPLPGDSWLCNRRPIWFAAFQLFPACLMSLAVVCLLHYVWWSTTGKSGLLPVCLVAVVVSIEVLWTLRLVWISAVKVDENFRLGVKRFGTQLSGFLAPGLQFVLPWFERAESVSLKLAVWGPRGEDVLSGEFRIGGTAGNGNPEPGRFETQLLGFWPLEINVELTLSLYRQGPAAKMAWWWYLNRYTTLDEIGQGLAQQVMPIVFKTAREMSDRPVVKDSDDPAIAKQALASFLNRMPEMAGKILLALIGIGREDRGGFLMRRCAITAVIPGLEFRTMMQTANKAELERYVQDVEGQATARRWKRYLELLRTIPEDQRGQFARMAELEVNRELFVRVGSGTDVLGALFAKLTANQASPTDKTKGDVK